MQTYICLLRGVNVGGNHRITMADLKAVFEAEGCQAVKTYLNSGNLIFRTDRHTLKEWCQNMILKRFGLDISCQILSAQTLINLQTQSPVGFNEDKNSKYNVIFPIAPWTGQDIATQMPTIKSDLENLLVCKEALFWTCAKKDFGRTTYGKLAAKKAIYNMTTVRNGNTFLKLVAIARDYVERFGG